MRRPRLIDRAAELAAIDTERRRAMTAEMRIVLITGDQGLGETRLVEHFLERQHRRMVILAARASLFSATTPFGVWVEAIERHLRHIPAGTISALCGDRAETLSAMLPSVAAARSDAPRELPARAWLLDGLSVLISGLARERPLAIFLDDLHLADPSSWEALHYLAHSTSGARVLVLATARSGELRPQRALTEMLGGLEQDGALSRLHLHPLDRDGVAELARTMLAGSETPTPLVDWLLVRSQGNRLFAIGLMRALLEQRGDVNAPDLRRLPEDLRERVLSRVRDLEPPVRALLEALAVVAGPAGLSTVGGLAAEADEAADHLAHPTARGWSARSSVAPCWLTS